MGYDRYVVYFSEDRVKPLLESLGAERFNDFFQCNCLKLPGEVLWQVQEKIARLLKEQEQEDLFSKAFSQVVLQEFCCF